MAVLVDSGVGCMDLRTEQGNLDDVFLALTGRKMRDWKPGRERSMRGLWKLIEYNLKLYLREPIASFFTLLYAPMMLVLFGSLYGNKPTATFGGMGTVDVTVPAYIALVIVTVGLMSVPINTSARRENGVLRRLRVTPLRPLTYLVADVVVYYLVTLLGVVLLVLVGRLGYGLHFQGNVFSVAAAFTLGILSFMALGYLIAGLSPTET